ncbi:anamorsin homolog [Hydra vulgaris]|uniref:anamorsin homolog n=1 Tax=Hydra vulgaris TaxID=6087 RepID=UPI001F5F7D5E|nr:anamorsin homolog [Hydra vulgaris]
MNILMDHLKANDQVLFIWNSNISEHDIKEQVKSLGEKVTSGGKVQVENAEILLSSEHQQSSFDVVFSGTPLSPFFHTDDLLAKIVKLLKPNCYFQFFELAEDRSAEKIVSTLTLTGFKNIKVLGEKLLTVTCQKPEFEVGKSSRLPLSLTKKAAKENNVWTLSALDMKDEEVDIIDSDALLDSEDLERPNMTTIKDCGTNNAGKRKACKGCTCGLAEELEKENAPVKPKSACGSCYLGDAFRCASCPYLGMPPFKPGDQITLSERQLKPDVDSIAT